MRFFLILLFFTTLSFPGFSQNAQKIDIEKSNDKAYSYAYILIQGKLFSKKLKVDVDLGDTPEQIQQGQQYSEKLTDKKSYAAILNFMVENKFELIQTLDYTDSYSGTGGTSGIVFIMRKK